MSSKPKTMPKTDGDDYDAKGETSSINSNNVENSVETSAETRQNKNSTLTDNIDNKNKRKEFSSENKKLQEEEVKVLKKQKKSNTNNEDNTAKAAATNTNLKMPENLKFEPKQPGTVKFVSYNVAGLNASLKKGFKNYIEAEDPDILCLEETKVSKEVDGAIDYKKYQYYWWGINETKKGHGGISVFSKIKPISSTLGLPTHPNPEITKGNIITLEFPELYYVACYVPNAGSKLVKLDERMGWDAAMEKYLRQLDEKKPVIWAGDLNVSHKEIDLTNPKKNHKTAGFTPEERGNFEKILNGGGDKKFVDTWRHFHPNALGCYTYYSYRYQCRSKNIGWRLDYHVVSERILDRVVESEIRSECYGASDHLPIVMILRGEL
nr:15448_t:CDS:2 [Entrophospora candida]CAG8527862.1 3282_t:CDS:2 [Entrophospora candida]